jgi:hypothetical protein
MEMFFKIVGLLVSIVAMLYLVIKLPMVFTAWWKYSRVVRCKNCVYFQDNKCRGVD